MTRTPKTTDGTGAPLDPNGRYYVQDVRQLVGNCVLWWGKDGSDYVCNLDLAGTYSGADVATMRDTDVPWPVAYVESRAIRHVRGDHRDFAAITWSVKQPDGNDICGMCGETKAYHRKHRPRHPFKLKAPA